MNFRDFMRYQAKLIHRIARVRNMSELEVAEVYAPRIRQHVERRFGKVVMS